MHCLPLVCLYGRPSSAARAVLSALLDAEHRLLVSTDRDESGRQIAADVARLAEVYGPGTVGVWLPDAEGLFEEERLEGLLTDLGSPTRG